MAKIHRIIVVPKKKHSDIFKIINLEIDGEVPDLTILHSVFANPETMMIADRMPKKTKKRGFKEVMYNNAVIDPEQDTIIKLCSHKGIKVEAAKVGYRYYGKKMEGLYVNKLVHIAYEDEPKLTTLKPRGVRQPMQYYNILAMNDSELVKLSKDRELHLSLSKMRKLTEFQKRLGLKQVTDVFLEIFGGSWSEHCFHDLWKSLGLFKILKDATEQIDNPNLISAFIDNAGVWDFYDGFCILFKLETHNSPTQKEPYGGQMTKLGGVLRDIFENGLGAKPIGNIEMTVVGEFIRKFHPEFTGKTLTASEIGRQTIRAIADYGNPMGIPMTLARMVSHPNFSGKPFALGGAIGITTRKAAKKGMPRSGDIAVMVGGRTGNDGLHGATVSSSGITEFTDTGDATHVQIGMPFIEQLMMRAGLELRDADCLSVRNDFGAHGIPSAFGEPGKDTDGVGGFISNLALVKLKCAGLGNWQIAISESQERFAHAVKPEKFKKAMAIYKKYGLEATPIGMFTDSGRFQMFYDPKQPFSTDMKMSGEICIDVPYAFFDECPLDKVEIVKPEPKKDSAIYPIINPYDVIEMGLKVVSHFDVCNQSAATTQYDSTVQGITWQGPLYGKNYDVASSLAVLKPIFRKNYGATISLSYSPWQFEVDPVIAAENAMLDAIVTQVVAGVAPQDIALADNFYTDGEDPKARWYLREQVKAITSLSIQTKTPFMVGKDSSAARGTFGGKTVCALPSVCITAMGKVFDVRKLKLHQWKKPGNALIVVGPRTNRLDGSILSSALGIIGTKLERMAYQIKPSYYLSKLYELSQSMNIYSAVPINRGGIFLRLFEGVEASGFGVDTFLAGKELFCESFGSVLLEVDSSSLSFIMREYSEINPLLVGEILPKKQMAVQRNRLSFSLLRKAWNKTFKQMIWSKESKEVV